MRFTAVTDSEIFRPRFKLEGELKEFMKMNVKMAEVSYGDRYSRPEVAARTLSVAAKRYFFPIKACVRQGKVYLVRVDMM